MNHQLLKFKPEDSTQEEYIKAWENSRYVLNPLVKLLEELISTNNKISKDDFTIPNHYAQLAFQAGENKAYSYILSLLPKYE